jgi:phospholipase C
MIALALSACAMNRASPAGTWSAPLARQRVAGSSSKISHVIVVVQENRSFENFFAGYPGADAPTSGCASPSPPPRMHGGNPPDVRPLASGSGCPGSDVRVPLHQATFEDNADLRHDWRSSMTDWNNGQMDGFSAWGMKHGEYSAYAYVKHSEIEPYWTMAAQYVLADAMFPTEFGGSFTGHLTLIAGTDDLKPPRHAEVDFPSRAPDDCDSPPGTKSSYLDSKRREHRFNGPFPCFDQFNTIAQVLDSAGVSWKIYATRVLDGGFWEPFEEIKYVRYGHDFKTNIIAPQSKFLGNAMHGKLASVNWVIPTKANSDHPGNGSDTGPSWVASVVNAVGESAYWPTSAIIVVWDDWGGFFDNAAPPQLDYRGLGIRVPCLIISPYAKRGYVSHVQYEWGSILRFIEEVNGFPAGSIGPTSEGYTDARASSLDDAFDFNQNPRQFIPITSKYSRSYFLHEPPSNEPADTQ